MRTGALEPVGRFSARFWGRAPFLSFLATLVVGAVLSAFVNNTPIVVLLLPILISVCLRTGSSASEVLMPMGFSTLVGGMATTIGTSTNLLVVGVAQDLGMHRFGMFDFAAARGLAAAVWPCLPVAGRTATAAETQDRAGGSPRRGCSRRACISTKTVRRRRQDPGGSQGAWQAAT